MAHGRGFESHLCHFYLRFFQITWKNILSYLVGINSQLMVLIATCGSVDIATANF